MVVPVIHLFAGSPARFTVKTIRVGWCSGSGCWVTPPGWFRGLYLRHGESFARWLAPHAALKSVIRRWMDSRIDRAAKKRRSWLTRAGEGASLPIMVLTPKQFSRNRAASKHTSATKTETPRLKMPPARPRFDSPWPRIEAASFWGATSLCGQLFAENYSCAYPTLRTDPARWHAA